MLVAYVQQQEEPPGLGIWHRDTGAVAAATGPGASLFFGFEVPRWTPDSRSVIVKLTAASSVAAQQKATPAAPDGLSAIRGVLLRPGATGIPGVSAGHAGHDGSAGDLAGLGRRLSL